MLVFTSLVVLWAYSFPGVHVLALVPCSWIVAIAALTWLVRGATYARWRRRRADACAGSALWFAAAPLGALLLALLLAANLPLRARWQASKSSFQDAVVDIRADRASRARWQQRNVGTYAITNVRMVQGAVIFYEKTGSFLDDAGFAHLPDGPSAAIEDGTFENPRWHALGDDWYAWTASW